jgi:hypothetical protein
MIVRYAMLLVLAGCTSAPAPVPMQPVYRPYEPPPRAAAPSRKPISLLPVTKARHDDKALGEVERQVREIRDSLDKREEGETKW